MLKKVVGPLFITAAAMLWATDAVFRFPVVQSVDPTIVVFYEHLIGTFILFPLAYLDRGKQLFRMGIRDWLLIALIGLGASAFGTVLFTGSFRYINPSVAILLQKLQPILVVILAYLFLRERPRPGFYAWSCIALIAATVLSFPDFKFGFFIHPKIDIHSRGVIYALIAAGLWAAATVAGKSLLKRSGPVVLTFWRYFFGLFTLGFLIYSSGMHVSAPLLANHSFMKAIIYMSFFPGIFAMILYYSGLSRTLASVATFVELIFPVCAVAVNTFVLNLPLSGIQLGAGAVLIAAVVRVAFL